MTACLVAISFISSRGPVPGLEELALNRTTVALIVSLTVRHPTAIAADRTRVDGLDGRRCLELLFLGLLPLGEAAAATRCLSARLGSTASLPRCATELDRTYRLMAQFLDDPERDVGQVYFKEVFQRPPLLEEDRAVRCCPRLAAMQPRP